MNTARASASAVLGRKRETSNDLRRKNEYAFILNELNQEGVCEVNFLAKFG